MIHQTSQGRRFTIARPGKKFVFRSTSDLADRLSTGSEV